MLLEVRTENDEYLLETVRVFSTILFNYSIIEINKELRFTVERHLSALIGTEDSADKQENTRVIRNFNLSRW